MIVKKLKMGTLQNPNTVDEGRRRRTFSYVFTFGSNASFHWPCCFFFFFFSFFFFFCLVQCFLSLGFKAASVEVWANFQQNLMLLGGVCGGPW